MFSDPRATRIHDLMIRALTEEGGLDRAAFETAGAAILRKMVHGFSPVTVAGVVALARAIPRLPEGVDWWESTEGRLVRQRLMEGETGYAEGAVDERLAPSAPDCWDPNWPANKVFRMPAPEGLGIGDTFLVGNGEGRRGEARVVERDGEIGVEIGRSWGPTDDFFEAALDEVRQLAVLREDEK